MTLAATEGRGWAGRAPMHYVEAIKDMGAEAVPDRLRAHLDQAWQATTKGLKDLMRRWLIICVFAYLVLIILLCCISVLL